MNRLISNSHHLNHRKSVASIVTRINAVLTVVIVSIERQQRSGPGMLDAMWHLIALALLAWLIGSCLIAVLVGKCMAVGSRADLLFTGEEHPPDGRHGETTGGEIKARCL
jgi:hypothetical protein